MNKRIGFITIAFIIVALTGASTAVAEFIGDTDNNSNFTHIAGSGSAFSYSDNGFGQVHAYNYGGSSRCFSTGSGTWTVTNLAEGAYFLSVFIRQDSANGSTNVTYTAGGATVSNFSQKRANFTDYYQDMDATGDPDSTWRDVLSGAVVGTDGKLVITCTIVTPWGYCDAIRLIQYRYGSGTGGTYYIIDNTYNCNNRNYGNGFSMTDIAWATVTGGFANDELYSHDAGDTATYTFTGLHSGLYSLSATYRASGNRTTNASYVLSDGLGSYSIDQTVAPDDSTLESVTWENIADKLNITDGNLTVTVSNAASSGALIVDALLLEYTPSLGTMIIIR